MTTTKKPVTAKANAEARAKRKASKVGILYILVFDIEGKQLVKIGITKRRMEDRVLEILLAIFQKYRVFPKCDPRRFTRTDDYAAKEKQLHKLFKDRSYRPSKKFGGYTEFFDVPVDEVCAAYDAIVEKKKPRKKSPAKKKGVFFSSTKT